MAQTLAFMNSLLGSLSGSGLSLSCDAPSVEPWLQRVDYVQAAVCRQLGLQCRQQLLSDLICPIQLSPAAVLAIGAVAFLLLSIAITAVTPG